MGGTPKVVESSSNRPQNAIGTHVGFYIDGSPALIAAAPPHALVSV